MDGSNSEWLNNLQVGDKVVIVGSGIANYDRISTVTRFTKTLIITTDERRFRRNCGTTPGGGYHGASLVKPTKELVERIKQEQLVRYLKRFNWSTLPLETLVRVRNCLQ